MLGLRNFKRGRRRSSHLLLLPMVSGHKTGLFALLWNGHDSMQRVRRRRVRITAGRVRVFLLYVCVCLLCVLCGGLCVVYGVFVVMYVCCDWCVALTCACGCVCVRVSLLYPYVTCIMTGGPKTTHGILAYQYPSLIQGGISFLVATCLQEALSHLSVRRSFHPSIYYAWKRAIRMPRRPPPTRQWRYCNATLRARSSFSLFISYLLSYMELIVRYFTMTDVHVHNISRLPKPELQHAQGERIMEQVRPRVSPIQVRVNPSTTMEAWAYTVGRAKKELPDGQTDRPESVRDRVRSSVSFATEKIQNRSQGLLRPNTRYFSSIVYK